MPWLCRDDEVLATLEVAADRRARRRGLLGRDGVDGALLLRPCRSVHTVGVRFPLDVAYCSDELEVLATRRMDRWRVGAPRLRARAVIEAEAGAFDRWRLHVGDRLEVR
jgi:uncharacterized membrane protein (UPF0127 family)